MRKIHIVGLALVSVLAFSAFSVTSAFALESVFLVNGAKATAAVPVDSELVAGTTLLLEDTKVPVIGKVDISCTAVPDEGSIATGGNAKLDQTTKVTLNTTNCTSLTANAVLLSIAAINLPWNTELTLSGTIFLDLVLPGSGTLQPSYEVKVEVLKIVTETDVCGSSTKSVDLDNSGSNLIALFLETETANCTIGGANTGLVVGEVEILATGGQTIAVSEG